MAKTTEKKTRTASGSPGRDMTGDRRKTGRALLLLLFFAVLTVVVFFALSGAKRLLFTDNERLTLRRIKISVQRDGYWSGKENKLCERIGLFPGVNIFAVDYARLREKIAAIPNIESVEIIPELPDSVELKLLERVPRAAIRNRNSPWVVDEKGVVIPRLESMAANWNDLPVITGVPSGALRTGGVAECALPALERIMAALRGFPDINILMVMISDPNSLDIRMYYQNKPCRVIMPRRNRGLTFMLSALQSAIIDAWRHRDERSTFILSYTGQVLIKDRIR